MPRTMTAEREAAIRKIWAGGAAGGTALLAELDAERAESQRLQSRVEALEATLVTHRSLLIGIALDIEDLFSTKETKD